MCRLLSIDLPIFGLSWRNSCRFFLGHYDAPSWTTSAPPGYGPETRRVCLVFSHLQVLLILVDNLMKMGANICSPIFLAELAC
jgi:hypothetical protein